MDNAKNIHNIEQTMTMWGEILSQAPSILFKLYNGLIEEGFEETFALSLTAEALKKMLNPAG